MCKCADQAARRTEGYGDCVARCATTGYYWYLLAEGNAIVDGASS